VRVGVTGQVPGAAAAPSRTAARPRPARRGTRPDRRSRSPRRPRGTRARLPRLHCQARADGQLGAERRVVLSLDRAVSYEESWACLEQDR
jgi:hypothetical protein